MSGYGSPEEAARGGESVPEQYAHLVAVERAPDGDHAVVFMAYDEPPHVEPYVVLCERTADGWRERVGGGGVGVGASWMSTSDDGSVGVETTWEPPTARWGVPAWPGPPAPRPGDGTW